MASRKLRFFTWLTRARRSARAHLNASTLLAPIVLVTGLVLPVQIASAYSIIETDLYQMGTLLCQTALDDGPSGLLGGTDHRSAVAAADIDEPAFCGCVGMAFVYSGPDQTSGIEQVGDEMSDFAALAATLRDSLDVCLDPGGFFYSSALLELDLGADDVITEDECAYGCQDGPIWEDEWDKLQCEYAIDGWVEHAGFDRARVQDWLDASGASAESLCTCVAGHMAEYAPISDGDVYWSHQSRAIAACQAAIWKRPLR
ncbi:hypothetical protein [Devosia sp.]|uniref:hypothetical protein n=1 Tax=Devosia sp. TaxID=1871048 RepID=UPI001AC020F7|nr:hypothetical protein [Devosia sp.]MBN9332625.1 hypothetical protein [Devosia sp.]